MPSLNFDASQVPETSFDPLPAGDYLVWITESDIPTDDQGNQKVTITMEVIEPQQYAGRKAWDSFTLENYQNPKWAETGRQILATVCRAIGVMSPRETEELHGIPFCVRLEVDAWKDGSIHNKVVARWSTSSQAPPLKRAAPKAPAQPAFQKPAPQSYQAPSAQYRAPQVPPAGSAYPGPGANPGQTYQPPPRYQAPQAPQAGPPAGTPPWAQHQPQPGGYPPPEDGQTPFQ
jgi:hypothetical protein